MRYVGVNVVRKIGDRTNPYTFILILHSLVLQNGIDIIWLTHSSAVEASQTRTSASIASLIGIFCERTKTPELICDIMNSPNSADIVLRS